MTAPLDTGGPVVTCGNPNCGMSWPRDWAPFDADTSNYYCDDDCRDAARALLAEKRRLEGGT